MCAKLRRLFVVCLGCLLLQACVPPPKRLLDEDARIVPGGRETIVVVDQGELRANIEVSNVSAGMGSAGAIGVLIGAVVDTTVNQNRANAAEESVKPLRNALIGYDFDRRALEATQTTLSKIAWLDADKKISFSKDGSKDKLLSVLDQSASPQILVARYTYELSPDFAQIGVSLGVEIYLKAAPQGNSPSDRVSRKNALYSQRFSYIGYLPEQTKDLKQNATKWAANDAQQARAILDAGLFMVEDMFIRSMSQSRDVAEGLDRGRSVDVGSQHGNLIETTEKGTLLYKEPSGTWVFVDGIVAPPK